MPSVPCWVMVAGEVVVSIAQSSPAVLPATSTSLLGSMTLIGAKVSP